MIISPSAISPFKLPTYQSGGTAPFSFGNALKFDGVNDFVSFPEIDMNQDFTLSFWSNLKAGDCISFCHSTGNDFFLYQNSAGKSIRVYDGADYRNYGTLAPLNTWVHYVIVGLGGNLTVYQDGVSLGTQSRATSPNKKMSRIQFYSNLTQFNKSQIVDEAAVWIGTGLTPTEISGLYNGGNGDFATNYQNANLIAYWRMNQADGSTTLIDQKGTYNGTLNNFSTPPAYFIPH